jgi:hypothetical protein
MENHPDPSGQAVHDALMSSLRSAGESALVARLVEIRREQGIERYGVALRSHNGRNARADAVQEAVDLALYLTQDLIERPQTDPNRLARVLELLIGLAAELEEE